MNTDPDKYKCSGYGRGFDSRSEFSFTDWRMGKNVIIFGYDISSSGHIGNKNKDPISFKQSGETFLLRLLCNLSNSSLFVNATKIYQLNAKDSEIKDYTQCLGNISKDFSINNIKIT